jgi:hypothetical protein
LQIIAEKNALKISLGESKTRAGIFAFWKLKTALRFAFAALLLAVAGIFGWIFLSENSIPIEQVKIEPTPDIQPTQIPAAITPDPTILPKIANVEKTPEPRIAPTNSPSPKPSVEPKKSPTPNIPTLATFILSPPTRGAGNLQTISISKQTTDVAFNLPLESDDFRTYQVTLKNQSGKVLWQSGNVNSKKSAINVRFPAKLLQSNIYSFAVSGKNDNDEPQNIGNYSFKSVIK